jgi:hypothetical protein
MNYETCDEMALNDMETKETSRACDELTKKM